MTKHKPPCVVCGKDTLNALWMDNEYRVPVCPECLKRVGIRCPVECGRCCDELWRKVPALARAAGKKAERCPNRTPTGRCGLRRDDMPGSCRNWVCPLGFAVLIGFISSFQARTIVSMRLQWEPKEWPKGWKVVGL